MKSSFYAALRAHARRHGGVCHVEEAQRALQRVAQHRPELSPGAALEAVVLAAGRALHARVLGAALFAATLDRQIVGKQPKPTVAALTWSFVTARQTPWESRPAARIASVSGAW